jgi:hypothetical protein
MSDEFEDPDAPTPTTPRFIRRIGQAIGVLDTPSEREAEEQLRVAKEQERVAVDLANEAARKRAQVESELPAARAKTRDEAAAVRRQVSEWIKDHKAQVSASEKLSVEVSDIAVRGKARQFLYGNTTPPAIEGQRLGSNLLDLCAVDRVVGTFYGLSQAAGNLLNRAFDLGADPESMAELDALECAAWSRMARRIRVLAGEE